MPEAILKRKYRNSLMAQFTVNFKQKIAEGS